MHGAAPAAFAARTAGRRSEAASLRDISGAFASTRPGCREALALGIYTSLRTWA